jgi:hypothetical protein
MLAIFVSMRRIETKEKSQFGYYEELAPWKPEGTGIEHYELLDAARGVLVDVLAYRVTYKAKSVIFQLNDLSQVKPGQGPRPSREVSGADLR